jgi:SAM-dependent methyltransferase
MGPEIRNLLYRHPEFYERVYPEPREETPEMCRRMFERYLPQPPNSILDIACGTGRDLAALSRDCPDCWGFDYLPEMIDYARAVRPHLKLQVGDMREVRLGRTFDVVTCMGSAITYALTNEDLDCTLATFAAHAHPGTLLILDLNNAAGYLPGGCFREEREIRVSLPDFEGVALSRHSFDRRRQRIVRRRTWRIPGREPVEDYCEYRLLFPLELEQRLAEHAFTVLGMWDNHALADSELTGPTLYVAARKQE